MFIRFVCAEAHPSGNGELGMFAARDKIDFSQYAGRIQRAYEEAFYWFSARGGGGLIYPKLKGSRRSPSVRKSLFWFKEDAHFWGQPSGSVVERARRLAEVITSTGIEIRELRVENPGEIIWEDLKQVLALPRGEQIPHAFRPDERPRVSRQY